MRDNQLVFEIKKGTGTFIGNAEMIAKVMDMCLSNIPSAAQRGTCKGWTIKEIGVYKKIYQIYEYDKLVKEGFIDDIANELFISPIRVLQASKYGNKILDKYYIKFKEYELVRY